MTPQPVIYIAGTPDNCHVFHGTAELAPDGGIRYTADIPDGSTLVMMQSTMAVECEGNTVTATCRIGKALIPPKD